MTRRVIRLSRRTDQRLPERASENELIRRYQVGRPLLTRALRRAASEGWAERLPGRGWSFTPLLSSELAYEQICRYRVIVEPAAILEPSFKLDRPAVEMALVEQEEFFESGSRGISPVEVFEIGSRFHLTVLKCSNNSLLINGTGQVYRARRLAEYKKMFDTPGWLERCREHALIAKLLLEDNRVAAADLMLQHLEKSAQEKNMAPLSYAIEYARRAVLFVASGITDLTRGPGRIRGKRWDAGREGRFSRTGESALRPAWIRRSIGFAATYLRALIRGIRS